MKFGRLFFFFNDTATTEIYTLSLHDALPISIVDLKTGRVHWIPHPLCCWPYGEPPYPEPLEFRLDSRLIVLTGARGETDEREGEVGVHFYEFRRGRFRHLHTAPAEEQEP